jgi:Tol biopolymer transport system component
MKPKNISHLISVLILLLAICLSTSASSARAPVPNLAGNTERVSIATDGTQGNGESGWGLFEDYKQQDISGDGQYVAFFSEASNLVETDTNGVADIFVHDRLTGETTMVSISSNGEQGNAKSTVPSISADGRYVAFESEASNLVTGDTNGEVDIFVRDRVLGVTTRVSEASDGTQANSLSFSPSISADGHYVAFSSAADNLVYGDTCCFDIFVHNLISGETTRVSITTDGSQANSHSDLPEISADGNSIIFISDADNLVIGDTNLVKDIFVHNSITGQTLRVSVATDGTQGNAMSVNPSLSRDGHLVVFASAASNLVDSDTNNTWDIFMHDLITGITRRISISSDGTQANNFSDNPSISADGRFIAFVSLASNLVYGDTNNWHDVFVHDRFTGRTTRASISNGGTQSQHPSDVPSISSGGRYVSFVSYGGDLVDGDTNGFSDVFVRDRGALSTILMPLVYR